jgi:hypothetical protein
MHGSGVGLLVDHLLFWNFEPYGTIFMTVCSYNRFHGNAIKGFRAMWDNIYDGVLTTLDFPSF